MNLTPVVTDIKFFGKADSIQSDCLSVTFSVPAGANTAIVNGFAITAGNSLVIEQSQGNIDVTRYQFSFTGAGANELYVLRILPVNK